MTVRELFEKVGYKAAWKYIKVAYIEPYWMQDADISDADIQEEQAKCKIAFDEFLTIPADNRYAPYTIIVIKSLDLPGDDDSSDLVDHFSVWCADEKMGMLQWFETVSRDRLVNCEVYQRSIEEYGAACVAGEMLWEGVMYGATNNEIRNEFGDCFWVNEDMPCLYVNTHEQFHRMIMYGEDQWAIDLPADAEKDSMEKSETLSANPVPGADYSEYKNRDEVTHFTKHRVFEKHDAHNSNRDWTEFPELEREQEWDRSCAEIEDFDRKEQKRLLSETKWEALLKEKGIWHR
ncbi:hypothetical protein AGMMS49983_20520 [Clostridia bacterium]|nr:hypothetical protein AGMMS49983_20520 [Clostridia bacterium]